MLRVRCHTRFVPLLGALAAGAVVLSCGGSGERDSVTAPGSLAAPPASDAGGSVTASATQKQDICHHDAVLDTYTTMSLTSQGAAAHLKAHANDYAGACVAPCPCFTAADLAQTCEEGIPMGTWCGTPPVYGFEAYCAGQTLGRMTVDTTSRSCYGEHWDPDNGNPLHVTVTGLTDSEVAGCKQLIVTGPYYPATCPR